MKSKSENEVVDEISELPDDVLVAIISRLTWREAIVTSILSTRWRHLYTYITRISFSTRHPSHQSKVKDVQQLMEKEFPKHMKEIYDFLASNRGCRYLEEFKVHIPSMKGANIHRWLPLVLEKDVESIDIRMIYHSKAMSGYYSFPRRTLIKRKGGGLGSFQGLKSLRQLSLHSLHVEARDVEIFVSNCTALEHLSIVGSYRLKKVSLVGHSKLKRLEISSSKNVVLIEVRDMINLVSLTCLKLQPKYSLHLNNVPKLVEFNSSNQFHLLGRIFLGILPSILDQLVRINVHSTDFEDTPSREPPIFLNLKHLNLQMKCLRGGRSFTYYPPFFWNCPKLQKLEIKFLWRGDEVFDDTLHKHIVKLTEVGFFGIEPRSHLKEVTLSGFIGCLPEISFSWLLMKEAVVLEKLVVELCDKTPEIRQKAEALAWEHIREMTPPSVNLVII
ncbi:F-box/FBD/LRR-repeat protein At1g13570-like [Primulina eburnea]|uniref:F-box/FBD/LRR-repeat protein At1g13570-like n=1 Tax=Primulina eburnea TaxID=1245227 RepID=UPI003C6C23A1